MCVSVHNEVLNTVLVTRLTGLRVCWTSAAKPQYHETRQEQLQTRHFTGSYERVTSLCLIAY